LAELAFDLVGSVNRARLGGGRRHVVPDWVSDVVPEWLVEVMRPKKAPTPWGTMARAVLAVWAPLALGFATGRRDLGLLPALGGLLSVMIDSNGPYWPRVERIVTAAVLGGAPGLLIGSLIHGHGWVAVLAIVLLAAVSAIISRLGAIGSVTGLQLFVYSAIGLGPLGTLRPWWHTGLQFLAGVVWALLLMTPAYLLSPRSAERKAVAEVYYALARTLRLIGTPGMAGARLAVIGALNTAYDAMLTGRASASGRSRRDMHLMAVLNASHQFVVATAALRVTGERVPALVTNDIERLGHAVLDERGPGSGALGFGGRRRAPPRPELPFIPPPWSGSPGALALREAMVNLVRVLAGNWTPPPAGEMPGLRSRVRAWRMRVQEQLIGGRIAWEFTIRLTLCTGVAAVLSEVLPLARSYWVVLTVGIIMKPDYGSVFARAVQRGIGTVVGAVLGAAILAVVPYGPWLLVPFGVLAALLPYGKARNFGLQATFLTPLVVLLIDIFTVSGWRLAGERLVDTLVAAVVVLLVGYAPWPSAWQADLPGQFAATLRAVCAYMDEALVATPTAQLAPTGAAASPSPVPDEAADAQSRMRRIRRQAYRSLSNLRAEFQRTLSEPTAVRSRATAWWPAVVALDEVMDVVTATVVAIGQGASVPATSSVHALTGALRAVAEAIGTSTPPRVAGPLPTDPELEAVTAAVRSVLSVLIRDQGGLAAAEGGTPAPTPA
jgi:uncharacterized membrane protein YccC